jgi:hypothetical protein
MRAPLKIEAARDQVKIEEKVTWSTMALKDAPGKAAEGDLIAEVD